MPRLLNDWIAAYMDFTAHNEAPTNFHFWTAISVIAGALRRKVRFDQLYYKWPCNFYIIFVAPPGIATKSTTMDFGMQLLRELDGPKFGPEAITWQALPPALQEATELVPMEDGLMHPMSCLTFAASELGTLLDPNDDKMLSILIEFWDGKDGNFRKWTKFSGRDEVINPWVNIIACTTPTWMNVNMPKALIGGGFASRCVFVYEEKKRNFIAYPRRHIPKDKNMAELREKLIHDLEQISLLRGEYVLTEDGYEWGEGWYNAHWGNLNNGNANEELIGYMARKQGHVHKLAMALTASRTDDMVIPTSILKHSVDIMTGFEKDIPKVFQQINMEPEMSLTMRIAQAVIRHAPRITQGALFRLFMYNGLHGWKDYQEVLGTCISSGLIRSVNYGGTIYLEPIENKGEMENKEASA